MLNDIKMVEQIYLYKKIVRTNAVVQNLLEWKLPEQIFLNKTLLELNVLEQNIVRTNVSAP